MAWTTASARSMVTVLCLASGSHIGLARSGPGPLARPSAAGRAVSGASGAIL